MSETQRDTLALRKQNRRMRQQRRRKIWAAISAFAISLPIVSTLALPAVAQEKGEYLEVTKTVSEENLQPGQSFTYSIDAVCSQSSCLNAELIDPLPAELENFELDTVETFGTDQDATWDVSWTEGGNALEKEPAKIGPETQIAIAFTSDVTSPEGTGLQHGTTFSLKLTLRVPDDIEPGDHDIENTAYTSADNAVDNQDSASIRVSVPVNIDVAPTKSWQPNSQDFNPGDESSIRLGVENTSNVPVSTLVVQEPQKAEDGAAQLDASNPFTITDFSEFGTASLPSGVQVQVDAYVKQADGTWAWQDGTAQDDFALPAGVDAADVGGLRFSYTGELAPGSAPNAEFTVAQREKHRNTDDDLSTDTQAVDNVVEAFAKTDDDEESERKTATADFRVTPADIGVEATKNIHPGSMAAGRTAEATISATNGSSPVAELRLSDLDFFTSDVTFGKFTAAPSWPTGATAAKVIYHLLDSDEEQEVTFERDETPDGPVGDISGFEIVYTADGNQIEPSTHATVNFEIKTTEPETLEGQASSKTLENTLTTTATAANGNSATDSDNDTLELITPAINVVLDKRVRPQGALRPGESAFVELPARATATDRATIHDIVIEDRVGSGEAEFWNAFDLAAIAPTQVPSNTTLTVEIYDSNGDWKELAVYGPESEATIFQLDRTELAAALTAAGVTDPTGIRFSFNNENGSSDNEDGFSNDLTVTPNLIFDARSTLRDSGDPTSSEGGTQYRNSAIVEATGESDGGGDLGDDDGDTEPGVVLPPQPGDEGLDVRKQWLNGSVDALSGQKATSRLHWKVSSGFDSVVITDPAENFDTPAGTIFDAFNLVQLKPIEASNDQFTNGWYLKYDTITAVELFIDGNWETVSEPAGGWVQDGRFVGYELTSQERDQAIGVRIHLAENEDARSAALDSGDDPFAPAPGSGVAASSAERVFDVEWQLRDAKRSDGGWVTGSIEYNLPNDQGMVNNTVSLLGNRTDGSVTARDDDPIKIADHGPLVKVEKSIDDSKPIFITDQTMSGDEKPTRTWTVTGKHDAVPKAGHVRIMDPAPCAEESIESCQTADPNANPFLEPDPAELNWFKTGPFKYFDITGVNLDASIPDQVDLEESVIWLLRYDDDSGEMTSDRIIGASALDTEDLSDVIGLSVTFQAENAGSGGVGNTITQHNEFTIEIESVLRETPRGESESLKIAANKTIDVDNRVFAQSYDDILKPDKRSGDTANVQTVLTGGEVGIAPFKSLTPREIVDADPDVEVIATLRTNQGADPRSTLSPDRVVIEDQADSVEFWDTFNFTGLGQVTLPAGADQVQVDVFGDFDDSGQATWLEGDAEANAELPPSLGAESFDQVEGIRFTFTRADGDFFDPTLPPANNWEAIANFTVEIRDTYRESGNEVTFDQTITNTQTSQSFRKDGKDSEKVSADAEIVLSDGTQEIAVKKLTNEGRRIARAGNNVPFELQFKNTGTGFLTITEFRDTPPAGLIYTGDPEPTYTAESDGLLSENVELELDDGELVFTWPEGENRMAPGETFTIDVEFELQPVLGKVMNDIVVTTAEELDQCGHIDGGGNWEQPGGNKTCATQDYVEMIEGANLFTVKGVQGSLDDTEFGGGYRETADGIQACDPVLDATGGSYYRSPCIAHSEVGGTDNWVLRTQNAGTVPVYDMVVFEQLPAADDLMIIGTDNPRESTFRPELVAESLQVEAPAGTETRIEVTTSGDVCKGTWSDLLTQEPCVQAGEVWTEVDGDTDWSSVTGLRVHLDFEETANEALLVGEFVDVTFSTKNVLAHAEGASGVPAVVDGEDQFAWNQFGVKYTDRERVKKIAPAKVGVHLRSSALEIEKEILGAAAEAYAPDSFDANVQCTVGDVELDMGDHGQVTLSSENDYRAVIGGIPFSSVDDVECIVTEDGAADAHGAAGSYGETERTISPAGGVLSITEPVDTSADDAEVTVPESQQAVITNTYDYTGLSVTKFVDTEATTGEFGPFDFELQCTSALGEAVTLNEDGETTLEFTLEDGETFTVSEDLIPVGAACVLTETDDFFADGRVFTGDNVTTNEDGTATITPGVEAAKVHVFNGYDSGTLTVEKIVEGAGAELYGSGPYGFDAQCTYQGQELLNENFELEAGATKSFGIFPAGTECLVTETATGGATTTVLDPEDGTVQVSDSDDETVGVTVTATNTFDVGSLEIIKQVEGAGAELYGAGPFTAEVMCTWDRDGVEEPIALANDGVVTLSEDNGYRALIDDLLVGAHCEVAETATGGANSTSVDPEDAVVTIPGLDEESQPQAAVVTLTNVFDVTSLDVIKELRGDLTATGADGPFEVELACLRDVDGESVPVDIPGGAVRELSEETDYQTTYSELPLGAECVVTETEDGGAASTQITLESADGEESTEGTSIDVTVDDPEDEKVVRVINTFDPDPVDDPDMGDSDKPGASSWLPRTGAEILTAIGVGLLLVLTGLGLYRIRRSRA